MKNITNVKKWHSDLMDFTEGDSLEIIMADIKELENDELSMREAGFMQGYSDVDEFEDYDLSFEGEEAERY